MQLKVAESQQLWPSMRLNTATRVDAFQRLRKDADGPIELHNGKRPIQAMERVVAEIERISALKKPQKRSLQRAIILEEWLYKALGVGNFEQAKNALVDARRQRVSTSIEQIIDRAALREVRAAKAQAKREERIQDRAALQEVKEAKTRAKAADKKAKMDARAAVAKAVENAREAKKRAMARKDDARQKIIVGGTIIAAILDSAPGSLTLLDGLKARLGDAGWRSVESVFTLSDDEKFLAEFLQEKGPDIDAIVASGEVGKADLVRLFHEAGARIEKALDLTQTWNGTDQRQQRAADARRKITVGGAVITSIREGDAIAPALLQLLDSRIGSTRDREAVRSVLPIGEFRPRGRP